MKTIPALPLKALLAAGACAGALLLLVPSAIPQGSLTPPGAPAQTMKTLDQIEPRGDVLKLPGDATSQFVISQPGSYYLSGNLTGVAGKNGIAIYANNVTLDLRGFSVVGVSGALTGIIGGAGAVNNHIQNGSCLNWPQAGLNVSDPRGCRVSGIDASSNGGLGIATGQDSVITDCVARSNTANGIQASDRSLVKNCLVSANATGLILSDGGRAEGCQMSKNTGFGVLYSSGCSMTGCMARENGGTGFAATNSPAGCTLTHCTAMGNAGHGIEVYVFSSVIDCTATSNSGGGISGALYAGDAANSFVHCQACGNYGNAPENFGISCGGGGKVVDCMAENNTSTGIVAGKGSSISGCTVRGNTLDGIRVPNDCCVAHNHVSGNGLPATPGAGIHATSDGNRIEENSIIFNNSTGLKVDGISNLITGNSSRFQGTKNFVIAAGNRYGQIVDLTATAGLAAVSSNAAASTLDGVGSGTANFAY